MHYAFPMGQGCINQVEHSGQKADDNLQGQGLYMRTLKRATSTVIGQWLESDVRVGYGVKPARTPVVNNGERVPKYYLFFLIS